MSKVRLFKHSVLWFSTVSLVGLAIIVLLTRFFLLQLPSYKHDLEQYLGEETGLHLSIGKVAARLDGFRPQISLANIRLDKFKQQASTLNIAEIRLSFDLFDLLSGRMSPYKTTIIDTRLSIRRFADGHLSIEGLSLDGQASESSADFSWLLAEGLFEVKNSQLIWQDDTRDVPNLNLRNAQLVFQNSSEQHNLGLSAELPQGGSFSLSINAMGDVLSGDDWRADGYFKAKQVDLQTYFSRLKLEGFSLKEGLADVELWSRWQDARLTQVKGYLQLKQANMAVADAKLALHDIASQLLWQQAEQGWDLQLDDFMFQANGVVQPKTALNFSYRQPTAQTKNLRFAADTVDLQALSYIARHAGSLKPEASAMLTQLAPSGELKKVLFKLNSLGEQTAWSACGRLHKVSSTAAANIPQLKNISAVACSSEALGWLDIDTEHGSIYFPGLFRDPIALDAFEGQLHWQRSAMGWLIDSKNLSVDTPHLKTNTRLKVQLNADGSQPQIDMQMNFAQADARFTPLYLPVGIMGDKVVNWLDQAFPEGRISGGGFLLKGPLAEFPYRNKQGLFQVLFNTEEVALRYAEGWPQILGAAAEVEFHNSNLTIRATQGTISGNKIEHATVSIDDLETAEQLHILGRIDDDISGLYQFFAQSPLNERMQDLLLHTTVSGPARIDLDIYVGLQKQSQSSVNVNANLSNNRMLFPGFDLALEGIDGRLHYDDTGLKADQLSASIFGEAVAVAIQTAKQQTQITAQGEFDVASLADKYPAAIWQKVTGRSVARLQLNLPYAQANTPATLSLSSELRGIAINLPAPLGKNQNATRRLKLETRLQAKTLPLMVSYGTDAKAKLRFIDKRNKGFSLDKADIHFGKGKAILPAKPGIRLSGNIKSLQLAAWKNAVSFEAASPSTNKGLNQLDLTVDKLHWLDSQFTSIKLSGEHKNSAWSGKISSPIIQGRYHFPDTLSAKQRIKLDLERLRLAEPSSLASESEASPLSPAEVPNIDIRSQQLFIGDNNLGELNLQLRQKNNGLIIQRLSLLSARDELNAAGAWEVTDGDSRTALKGRLNTQSLGDLLDDTGISDKLKTTETEVEFDLHWPGGPQAFSKDHLSGFAKLNSGKGRLLDVEPGIGRIFGLLSLSTLQRRLQLDFSDLVQRGLSFDKIKGRILINDGEAVTERFYLESPAVRLDFQGRVGLAAEDLDQLITVTPKTTESLPLAGALAGGPLVGAAVFIAQKIAGKTVNKLVGYQYRVTGPWKDPNIKQLSKPGGKIFGMVDNVLSPVLNLGSAQ